MWTWDCENWENHFRFCFFPALPPLPPSPFHVPYGLKGGTQSSRQPESRRGVGLACGVWEHIWPWAAEVVWLCPGLSHLCVPYGIRGTVNLKTTLLQGHSMVLSENSFKWFGMFVVNSILYPWFSHSPLEGLLKHSLLVPCLSPQSGWSSRSGAGIYSRKCALRTTVLYPPTFFSMCNLVQHSDARMLSFCRVAPDQSCPMETWFEPNM